MDNKLELRLRGKRVDTMEPITSHQNRWGNRTTEGISDISAEEWIEWYLSTHGQDEKDGYTFEEWYQLKQRMQSKLPSQKGRN